MDKLHDVVIAGGGPIGLFLSCELALAGVSVLVLERDVNPDSRWKIAPLGRRGLNTPSVEGFYRRGLLYKLFDQSKRASSFQKTSGFQFGGHFAGITLNANKLELDRWKYRLPGPALCPGPTTMDNIEKVLAERAESLGVIILRGEAVTRIVDQNADNVTVETETHKSFRGRWLVGCDGGRSLVRKAAGFEFVGTEAQFTGYAVECTWDHPEKLKTGFNITKTGMSIISPNTLHLMDFDGGAFDRTKEITLDHIQTVKERITGMTDVNVTEIQLASAFTDRSKQTTTYRRGRILLAGDAAHIHSPLGAQGLNVGLGDAINLGWKLAAIIRQEASLGSDSADLTLLDTYESERHPVAAWVLEWTRAQVATLQPDLYGAAVQTLIRDLLNTTDGTNLFIDRIWGLSQRYQFDTADAHAHPLVGCSAPDFELLDDSRLGSKLERGTGLLVDFADDERLKELLVGSKYETRAEYMSAGAKDRRGIRSLLIRPDGVVAWVVEDDMEPDIDAVKVALERWFGF